MGGVGGESGISGDNIRRVLSSHQFFFFFLVMTTDLMGLVSLHIFKKSISDLDFLGYYTVLIVLS